MDISRQDFTLDVSFSSDTQVQPVISDVVGTVREIPSANYAMVDVESIGLLMCFRGSLNVLCRSVKDVLKIGNTLALRLRYGRNNEWLVLSAHVVAEEQAPDKQLPVPVVIKKETNLTSHESKPGECGPFAKIAVNKRYLLNWPGFLTILPETGIARLNLEHKFGSWIIYVDDPVVKMLVDNKPFDCAHLLKFLNRAVRFDAVLEGSGFTIEKLWLENKVSSESLLLPEMNCHRAVTRPGRYYNAKVTSIPFHDSAIATVGELPVFVPIESFVTEELMNWKWSTVSMFVDKGSSVVLGIKQSGGGFRAERCFGTGVSKGGKIEIESYLSKWGPVGKCTKEGVLARKNEKMYVVVEGSDMPIEEDMIFAHGKQVTALQLVTSVGRKVTCLCRPGNDVICAWWGVHDCTPLLLLKDKLAVPKGVVYPDLYYDAVVDEFPLPGFAICRIGVLPVLLPVTEKRDLKRGDVLSLCIEEKVVDDVCYLMSNTLKAKPTNESLLLNFRGRVVEIGSPFSTIRSEDFDVLFEWSAVKWFKNKCCQTDDSLGWFKRVREVVNVGTWVQFTAKMDEGGFFYAVEICVVDES